MGNMKSVVIIMASYNGEKYIREQIDSILNQTYKKWTLLIRDDGSSDQTQSIIRDYCDRYENIKFYTGEHMNVANGFIDLLRKAPLADYYAFADQDDVWKPEKIQAAVDMLSEKNQSTPLFYYCATTLVDQNLAFIKEHGIHEGRTDKARFLINDMSGNTVVINSTLRKLICDADCSGISIHDKWTEQVCLANGGLCISDSDSHILYRQHISNTIGMELTFGDKVRKFFSVVNGEPDGNLAILKKNYDVVEPYKSLVDASVIKPMKWKVRWKLAFDKEIDFDNFLFNLAFKLRCMKGIL